MLDVASKPKRKYKSPKTAEHCEKLSRSCRRAWARIQNCAVSLEPRADPEKGLSYLDRGEHRSFAQSVARARDPKRRAPHTQVYKLCTLEFTNPANRGR
jgi:hypothetical protein